MRRARAGEAGADRPQAEIRRLRAAEGPRWRPDFDKKNLCAVQSEEAMTGFCWTVLILALCGTSLASQGGDIKGKKCMEMFLIVNFCPKSKKKLVSRPSHSAAQAVTQKTQQSVSHLTHHVLISNPFHWGSGAPRIDAFLPQI